MGKHKNKQHAQNQQHSAKPQSHHMRVKTYSDRESGDVMCDLSYPHGYEYNGVGLEIKAQTINKGMNQDPESQIGIDVVNDFKLIETPLSKEEFKAWSKIHLAYLLERCIAQRLHAFKTGSTEMCRFILMNYESFTVYMGPSKNTKGSFAFAYQKDAADDGPTFLYFFDGMKEGEKLSIKGIETKIKSSEMTLKEKKDMILATRDGISALIKIVLKVLRESKENSAKNWLDFFAMYQETFALLPGFDKAFIAGEKFETVLQLSQGQQAKTSPQQMQEWKTRSFEVCMELIQDEKSMKAAKLTLPGDKSFTKTCIQTGLFSQIIGILGQITKEFKREKVVQAKGNDSEDESEEELQVMTTAGVVSWDKDSDGEVKEEIKHKAATATAHAFIGSTSWSVDNYLKTKDDKAKQIIKVLGIMQAVVETLQDENQTYDDHPLLSAKEEKNVKEIFLASSLLPVLEAALRAGTILEMAKDLNMYLAYLSLVEAITTKPSLFGLLLDIGDNYEPKQKESLNTLLSAAADMAQVFLDCMDPAGVEDVELKKTKSMQEEQAKQADQPSKIAERMVEVNHLVNSKIEHILQKRQSKSPDQLAEMPLNQAFSELLNKYRVKRHSLREGGKPEAAYKSFWKDFEKKTNPRPTKLVRLAQEVADMSNSLPVCPENSIFVVVDYQRADYMKAMIFGAQGTPYAHGAFMYDIFFPDTYPQDPPKMNLMTTGGGTVRFNPNLYNSGYVCLSLLGTWGHDWLPKVSTAYQCLIAIQAIVMGNDIYFNEPGWTNSKGTPEGELRNNGYKNVVRYANLKYAIIESLRNPPQGFAEVIRRNFFLKKEMIMSEVDEWIVLAKTEECKYAGQNQLDQTFKQSRDTYLNMMIGLKRELVDEFAKLTTPYMDEGASLAAKKEGGEVLAPAVVNVNVPDQDQAEIDKIDVTFDVEKDEEEEKKAAKEIDINDSVVKDRWSRYIGAMGIEAVAKQAEATILLSGLGGLGVEIAKNLVLAGCKELILHDTQVPTEFDLASQFFLSESDIGQTKNRAQLCRYKLQQLNSYVKVSYITDEILKEKDFFVKNPRNINVAVFTDCFKQSFKNETLSEWNAAARQSGISMIIGDQNGVFSRILTDFGPNHTVIDKNGEDIVEVMIHAIEPVTVTKKVEGEDDQVIQHAKIHLPTDKTHNFEQGDQVILSEVIGMNKEQKVSPSKAQPKQKKNKKGKQSESQTQEEVVSNSGVNGETFTIVDIVNTSQFIIDCDTTQFSCHVRDGIAKELKQHIQTPFQPLKDLFDDFTGQSFDQDLQYMDFEKISNFKNASICYKLFGKGFNQKDVLQSTVPEVKDLNKEDKEKFNKFASAFIGSKDASLGPICALIGGIVVGEVVKAITKKYMPIRQEFYFDAIELYEQPPINLDKAVKPGEKRYKSILNCFGQYMLNEIRNSKVFMVGAGAIGCELLKNFAMLGLGSGEDGKITLTDPDIIELSNLNRQFLFREKHLRKPKSMVAAAAAIQMNKDLKNHVSARLDKIHQDTENIYTEEFYKKQTLIANALDNVKARLFIDAKCVQARVPLLDSGTLGPKGHVQVVIPFKTEAYGSRQDPEDNNAIPHCTLKMFPEETLHCVEWSKTLFETQFGLNPQNFNKLKESTIDELHFNDMTERKNIKKTIKYAEQLPTNFNACIAKARSKFQKLYHNDILQLLHVYPLDHKDPSTGRPFWSLPKRPPTEQIFDPSNEIHRNFVASYSCLMANMYGIKNPHTDPRSDEAKILMAKFAQKVEVKQFQPDDSKAEDMRKQLETEDKEEAKDDQEDLPDGDDIEDFKMIDTQLLKKKSSISSDMLEQVFSQAVHKDSVPLLKVEEFEKDEDSNFHIDFIHSAGNARALNYGLKEMDWITVKLKAGRIVPALATTTAAVAGLQTIELLKLIKRGSDFAIADSQFKFENCRNAFLNLAVPSMILSEPDVSVKSKLKEDLTVDTWERWEIQISDTTQLGNIVKTLEKTFKLQSRDIMYGATSIFAYAFRDQELAKLQQPQMKQTLLEIIGELLGDGALNLISQRGYADLTVTFIDPDVEEEGVADDQRKLLENVPTVRIVFNPTSK